MSKSMSQTYAPTCPAPNLGGAKTCTDNPVSCTISPLQAAITDLIKFKKPHGEKAWAYLGDLFGLKERAAKHRLSNSVSYSIEELQVLIQGDDGWDFLVVLMADAQPLWWLWLMKIAKLARVRRRQAEDQQEVLKLETSAPVETGTRRRLKRIRDADQNLSATVAVKETAMGFLYPNGGRAVHGSMAEAQGKAQTHAAGVRR
jgi:hypothetical protein